MQGPCNGPHPKQHLVDGVGQHNLRQHQECYLQMVKIEVASAGREFMLATCGAKKPVQLKRTQSKMESGR